MSTGKLGLVMTGGGARAAYQVGFLTGIADTYPELSIPYLTGVSAGAINAAFMASHNQSFLARTGSLADLWASLNPEDVFEVTTPNLLSHVGGWAGQLMGGGRHITPRVKGMLSTSPLERLMRRALPEHEGLLVGIDQNIMANNLEAIGITTTDYGTGQSVTWVHGNNKTPWRRPYRRSETSVLTVDHIMASAALPLMFPAVQLQNGWHGDGGIRLTAPLSPAMHLGADRIIAISNRYGKNLQEAELPVIEGYPPPAQVIGSLLNAIFLDMLDYDATNMRRYNELLKAVPPGTAPHLRHVDVLILRPSRDLGRLAREFEARLPTLLRFLTRGFGTQETQSPDALSLLMFQHDYVNALLELGRKDARDRRSEIDAFLTP